MQLTRSIKIESQNIKGSEDESIPFVTSWDVVALFLDCLFLEVCCCFSIGYPLPTGNTAFGTAFYMFVVAPFMFVIECYVSRTSWLLNIEVRLRLIPKARFQIQNVER